MSTIKKVVITLVVVAAIIIASVVIILYIDRQRDSLYVEGLYGAISIPYKNQSKYFTGTNYCFTAKEGKDNFFSNIEQNYLVFESTEEHIDFKFNKEICSLYFVSDEKEYRLTSNYLNVFDVKFPVPLCQMDKYIGGNQYKFECDMDYLRSFYNNYSDIEIDENHIEYRGICATYNDGVIAFKKIK